MLFSSCFFDDTMVFVVSVFFFQAEDGIRDLVRSRGLGDVYKRQGWMCVQSRNPGRWNCSSNWMSPPFSLCEFLMSEACLLYTSDAADERSSVDLGGRRIIKKKICLTELVCE